jgi:hypothetical protein
LPAIYFVGGNIKSGQWNEKHVLPKRDSSGTAIENNPRYLLNASGQWASLALTFRVSELAY